MIFPWIPLITLVVPAQGQQAGRCRPANVVHCPEGFYAAPGTASKRDKDAVSRAIQDALDARLRRIEEEKALALLAEYVNNPSLDPRNRTVDKLTSLFYEAQRARKAAEDAEYDLFNAAVAVAVPAYNLTPPRTSFPDSPRGKETNPWNPRFSKLEKYDKKSLRWRARTDKEIEDEAAATPADDGRERPPLGVFAAQTWSDGRISMHWLAFVRNAGTRRSPVYIPDPDGLAALIAHETVHWVREHRAKDSTSRMRIFESYAGEAEGNAAQADLLRKQGNPSAAEFSGYSQRYLEQARQMAGMPEDITWEQVERMHPDWLPVGGHGRALPPGVPAPAEPGGIDGLEWARDHSERSFAESLGSLGDLAADARRAADAHESGREAHRERERQERLARLAQNEARQSAAWDYLVATARLACTDPDSLEEQVRLKRAVGADADSLYLMDRLAKTQASGWDNLGKGLSACGQTLINRLLRNRGPAAVYDLLGWAREYRQQNPSLGESISGALIEFFDAVGQVPAPGESTSPPEAPRRGSEETVSETTRPPRERDMTTGGDRGGIYVPPCLQEAGRRCVRWR